MIIRSIYLHIGELGLPSEYVYDFKKKSRFICNWLEREVLQNVKFKSDEFDRIVVSLCSDPRPVAYVNTSKVVCVELELDRKSIDAAGGDDLSVLQISLLKHGIRKCAVSHAIPKAELIEGLSLFERQGMVNIWVYKNRVFKEHCFSVQLIAEMTSVVFILKLKVLKRAGGIFEAEILRAEPDEVVFNSKFKDIEVADGVIVVTAKIGNPLWSRSLAELKYERQP